MAEGSDGLPSNVSLEDFLKLDMKQKVITQFTLYPRNGYIFKSYKYYGSIEINTTTHIRPLTCHHAAPMCASSSPKRVIQVTCTLQIMPRAQNVHAVVNAGFMFKLGADGNRHVLEKPNIVYGGITSEFVSYPNF
ncbi:hypothetical protein PR048_010844 [Dryococelus australis]|uniref:Uncharacterized protein n=1 Tax=Dryococelus australis TaxID=614101 RepID=A0ABQ9I3U7_9NEOP|nr:hypothetical protein PR048_010844 [Dryococelus australis]